MLAFMKYSIAMKPPLAEMWSCRSLVLGYKTLFYVHLFILIWPTFIELELHLPANSIF